MDDEKPNLLRTNGYIVIQNLITPQHALFLQKCLIMSAAGKGQKDVDWPNGDDCVAGSIADYNSETCMSLLFAIAPIISKLCGKTLVPTYTYTRIYKNNAQLKAHVDRPSCEYSVTLNVGQSHPWEINMINLVTGEDVAIRQNPGDAVVYKGCEVTHYRPNFTGDWYAQIFLHFVDENGPCKSYAYDKKNVSHLWFVNNPLQYIDMTLKTSIIKKQQNAVIPLQDYIKVYNTNFSDDFLENVLKSRQNPSFLTNPVSNMGNSFSYKFKESEYEYDKIWENIDNCLKDYINDTQIILNISQNNDGYTLLKNEQGGYCREHIDTSSGNTRVLSIIMLLNDDFEGGQLTFFNDTYEITLKTNQIAIFPSNFLYPYQVKAITNGKRYTIVTWVS